MAASFTSSSLMTASKARCHICVTWLFIEVVALDASPVDISIGGNTAFEVFVRDRAALSPKESSGAVLSPSDLLLLTLSTEEDSRFDSSGTFR